MQLDLLVPRTAEPHAQLWTALDEEARRVVLERLAEVIAKAALAKPETEANDHD